MTHGGGGVIRKLFPLYHHHHHVQSMTNDEWWEMPITRFWWLSIQYTLGSFFLKIPHLHETTLSVSCRNPGPRRNFFPLDDTRRCERSSPGKTVSFTAAAMAAVVATAVQGGAILLNQRLEDALYRPLLLFFRWKLEGPSNFFGFFILSWEWNGFVCVMDKWE